jgi:hypothetical protein
MNGGIFERNLKVLEDYVKTPNNHVGMVENARAARYVSILIRHLSKFNTKQRVSQSRKRADQVLDPQVVEDCCQCFARCAITLFDATINSFEPNYRSKRQLKTV